MRKVFFVLAALACLGLAGCETRESIVQDAIRAKLIDPKSAMFSDFVGPKTLKEDQARDRFSKQSLMYVQVNAKNSFGGFTGKKEWAVFLDGDGKIGKFGPAVGPTETLRAELIEEFNSMKPDFYIVLGKDYAERLALLGDLSYLEKVEGHLNRAKETK